METEDNPRLWVSHAFHLLLVGVGILFLLFLWNVISANQAHADIACGSIQCTVGSKVSSAGGFTSGSPDTGNGSGNGSGNSGSGSSSSPYRYSVKFVRCAYWLSAGTGASTFGDKYPRPDEAQAGCAITQGMTSSDKYVFSCPVENGKSPYGREDVYQVRKSDGVEKLYSSTCVYPADAYWTPSVQNIEIPSLVKGTFTESPWAGVARTPGSSGSLADSTSFVPAGYNPGNPTGSPTSVALSWDAKTLVYQGKPVYGYYRLDWNITMEQYRKTIYPAWMGYSDNWRKVGTRTSVQSNPYTYACNFDPAMKEGIVGGANFDIASCAKNNPPTSWSCKISDPITYDGATGTNLYTMRDGRSKVVKFPTLGISGAGVSNPRDFRFYNHVDMTKVSPTSNPVNGLSYNKASWAWDTWVKNNGTGTLAFYWASDAGQGFWFTSKNAFTAEFLVPTAGSINAPTVWKWETDDADCGTITSPTIHVLRATGNPTG